MQTFGLIGKSLQHSASQEYFTQKFHENHIHDAEYCLFPLASIEDVKPLLHHPTLLGFNVTIPYKSEIIPCLDELDPVAREVGAVNCVIKENNRWIGYNTDVIGFERMFYQCCRDVLRHVSTALVLGSGGAAKAVCYVLKQRNIPFTIVSRIKKDETIVYTEVTKLIINNSSLIINTTPLGMFPNTEEMPPIPYPAITHSHTFIDLIYNPKETKFLKEGKKRGALIINGVAMFKAQAEASYIRFIKPIL